MLKFQMRAVIQNMINEQVSVCMYNLIGEKIYSQTFDPAQVFEIELHNSFSGIVNVEVSSNSKFYNTLVHIYK